MALGGVYETGTITISAVDKVSVTGVGTLWGPVAAVGDWILCNGQVGLIAALVDDTHLTLESQWQGTLPTAATYVLIKMSWLRYDPALTQAKIRELLASLMAQGSFLFVKGDEPDPALGEDGQWALKTDVQPWQLWYKDAGVWVPQATPAGLNWRGAWSSAATYNQADAVQAGGSSYVSRTTNINKPPAANPADWDLMAQAGTTGAAGTPGAPGAPGAAGPPGMVWRGNWNSATAYIINDAVADAGASYIAIAPNTNSRPPSASWNLIASGGASVGPDSITPPMLDAGTAPKQLAFRDRLNFLSRGDTASQSLSGPLVLAADPAVALAAATRQYVDKTLGSVAVQQEYTATQGQTTFTVTGGYTPGKLLISRDGVLADFADYTAIDGATFTLATACEAGEVLKALGRLDVKNGVVLPRFRYIATAGQTTFSGPDANGATLTYSSAATIEVFTKGALQPSTAYTAATGTSIVLGTGLAAGDVLEVVAFSYSTAIDGVSFLTQQGLTAAQQLQARSNIYAAPFDAMAFNSIVLNGAMIVSQENGSNVVAVTSPKYIVDGWQCYGTAAAAFQGYQAASGVPGFPQCLVFTATVGAAVPANDAYLILHGIEGYRVAGLAFGTAAAQSVTIGFWIYVPIAGTACLCISNEGNTRSYFQEMTFASAGWNYRVMTFPGDITGAWNVTTGVGLRLRFCFGGNGNVIGTAGVWSASAAICTASQTNFFATGGNVVCLTGVSAFAGTEAPSIGRVPFLMRPYDREFASCLRYMEVIRLDNTNISLQGMAYATTAVWINFRYSVVKRVTPTLSATGSWGAWQSNTAQSAITMGFGVSTAEIAAINATGGSGLVSGNASGVGPITGTATLKIDARLP